MMQMKRHFLALLAFMPLTVMLLTGCRDELSTREDTVQVQVDKIPYPSAGSSSVPGAAFSATVALSTLSGDYSRLSDSYEGISNIAVGADWSVSWTSPVYYPSTGDWIYLVAVSPVANPSGGVVSYILTGTEDLLYAPEVRGNRWDGELLAGNTDSSKNKPLDFVHLLTRLQLKACKEQTGGVSVQVYRVTVREAKSEVTVSLSDGRAVFSSPTGLSIDLSGDKAVEVTSSSTTADPVELGDLLLPPLTGGESYTLDVETSVGTYTGIPITFPGALPGDIFRAGLSHEVTLSISDHALEVLSVTATPWEMQRVDGELDLMP